VKYSKRHRKKNINFVILSPCVMAKLKFEIEKVKEFLAVKLLNGI